MDPRIEQARQLEARASEARTLAEAQALHARADRLRGLRTGGTALWSAQPLFRN